jgi:tRNA-splicing ligase RtcB (3'-phosphate/5'-hydroxy nucleic acid ligase)
MKLTPGMSLFMLNNGMMNGQDFINLGFEQGPVIGQLMTICNEAVANDAREKDLKLTLDALRRHPRQFVDHLLFGEIAQELAGVNTDIPPGQKPLKVYGKEGIDAKSLSQMDAAMALPVTVQGAAMADGHVGYGLMIGGVIACDNAVVPNAVGFDIACRMKMSLLDLSPKHVSGSKDRLINAIENETSFGVGADFPADRRREHEVMDDYLWDRQPMSMLKDTAWKQLGSSGSGNHFVEFGLVNTTQSIGNAEPGEYLAILSHGGSRGPGHKIAKHFIDIAVRKLPAKYKVFRNLAWLSLDSDEGQQYWEAMNLMGRFASANHELIHKHVARAAGAKIIAEIENHHNFAWKEQIDGRELIVHRKGATPAHTGVMGVIPGSMADPCYVVLGKGEARSLNSASHGAGRKFSRKEAKETFTWSEWRKILEHRGVHLISGGLDEVPGAYKDIREVMASQVDLVEIIAEFWPKIVKMGDDGKSEG